MLILTRRVGETLMIGDEAQHRCLLQRQRIKREQGPGSEDAGGAADS